MLLEAFLFGKSRQLGFFLLFKFDMLKALSTLSSVCKASASPPFIRVGVGRGVVYQAHGLAQGQVVLRTLAQSPMPTCLLLFYSVVYIRLSRSSLLQLAKRGRSTLISALSRVC